MNCYLSNLLKYSLLLLPLLTGCGTKQESKPEINLVETKLEEASELISHDLALLTGSTQRKSLEAKVTGGLGERMDLNYAGSLEGALEKVCARAGFSLNIEGQRPLNPPLVHLNYRDRTCLALLRSIGEQTSSHEGVEVHEESRRVTLIYHEKLKS